MKDILKKHHDLLLGVLVVLFIGIIAGYYFWGVGSLVGEVGSVVAVGHTTGGGAAFDIAGAKALDLRGLAQ